MLKPLKLKDVCKGLSSQYLKENYVEKEITAYLENVNDSISKNNFTLMDDTDISKKHAKYMEALEFVKNGGTRGIGLGHNVLNINTINIHKEITPLYSKVYRYKIKSFKQ